MRIEQRALMVYLEPTPYVLGLVEAIRSLSPWPPEVWFLGQNLSQDWQLKLPPYCRVFSSSIGAVHTAVWHELRSGAVHVLHLCGWGGHDALKSMMLMGRLAGVPVVVESDTQASPGASRMVRALKAALFPLLFRLPRAFMPGGTRQKQYLRAYGVPEERLHIAQMTVDVESISQFAATFDRSKRAGWRAEHGIESDAPLFLFVGRLEDQKGIRELLSAFESLAGSGVDAWLAVVGDGTLRGEVERASARSPRVVAAGRLTGQELLAAYCAADIFVLPSRFEPWGLVVNEAMACGLPVIASDRVGCVEDLLVGKETGLVYAYDDPTGLRSAMHCMATDAEKRLLFGRNASRVIEGWTLNEEARRVVSTWQAVG